MKKSRTLLQVLTAMAVSAVLFIGCGSAGESAVPAAAQYNSASPSYAADAAAGGAVYEESYGGAESGARASEGVAGEPKSGDADGDIGLPQDRKLIQTVELEMETKEFDRMMAELETQIQAMGGYIENLETYNGSSYSSSRSSRWANLTIRIPASSLNGFLQDMSEIGNVVRRSDSVEDVTLSYVDMESRRDTLKAEQTRLLELLEKAETVEDMIALEERLSDVRYYLESMESKLRIIDNQVDYSTVHLNLAEVKELTPVEERTDLQRIAEGFVDSIKSIGNGVREGVIWFVIHIPYLALWAAAAAVAIVLFKGLRKKRAARKAAKGQRKEPKGQGKEPDESPREKEGGDIAR